MLRFCDKSYIKPSPVGEGAERCEADEVSFYRLLIRYKGAQVRFAMRADVQ